MIQKQLFEKKKNHSHIAREQDKAKDDKGAKNFSFFFRGGGLLFKHFLLIKKKIMSISSSGEKILTVPEYIK